MAAPGAERHGVVLVAAERERLVEEVVLARSGSGDIASCFHFEGDDVGCRVVGRRRLGAAEAAALEAEIEDEDTESSDRSIEDPEDRRDPEIPIILMIKDAGVARVKRRGECFYHKVLWQGITHIKRPIMTARENMM